MPSARTLGWLVAVAGVVAGQAGVAVRLFGSPAAVRDDRPVTSGRHPLHLYHAGLGADTFRQRHATACYDPNFQAGYPKTPVFDAGCRPAEVSALVAGGGYKPAAYKIGLFALCVMVPIAFAVAAAGASLTPLGRLVAAAGGCGVWWSPPVRALLDAGDVDLLLAGLCGVVFVPWLGRYQWDAGPVAWAVLAAAAVVGWYAHPVVWLGVAPVFAVYYLAAAPRHGPAWHLGLAGVTLAGVGPNLWWLWDWGKFWWLRQPSVDDLGPLPTWGALVDSWRGNAALLGPAPFGWPVVVAGLAGCGLMLVRKQRTVPGVLVLGGVLAFAVARLGQLWPPLVNGAADRGGPMVAAVAVVPAAGLLAAWAEAAVSGGRNVLKPLAVAAAVGLPVAAGWGKWVEIEPLPLGLTADQQALVHALIQHTTPDARILLEEPLVPDRTSSWTAMLAELTDRPFLGGLDTEACSEHSFCSPKGGTLAGRPLDQWADADLAAYARRYNVGWVVAQHPATVARWGRFPGANRLGEYDGRVLFALDRPRSFVLLGSARRVDADRQKVVLTDVVPADADHPGGGPVPAKVIVLSLHHQAGMRVSPDAVTVDRDPDPFDPIPMIRLRLAGPVSRVVLSWEN